MKMLKRILIFLIVLSFFSLALAPLPEEANTWRSVFETIIMIVLMFLGAPLTQWLKNILNVTDKKALLLTAAVAVVIAIAEVLLAGVLTMSSFTIENFPFAFTTVMTVATFYYHLLKDVDNFLGSRGLLKVT